MPRVAITGDWSIELEPGFRRKVEPGEDLALWKGDRTVYVSVYRTETAEADEAISRMLENRPGEVVEKFDRVEPGVVGHAYLLPEGQGPQCYWGLNTWTAIRGSVACVTLYFQHLNDLEWALAAWRSVQCGACGEKSYQN
jgi:hypothetical protein